MTTVNSTFINNGRKNKNKQKYYKQFKDGIS